MGAFMYPIEVCYKKKVITTWDEFPIEELTSTRTLDVLSMGQPFKLHASNDRLILTVYYKRLETDAELAARVDKEEAYMNQYNIHQALYAQKRSAIKK